MDGLSTDLNVAVDLSPQMDECIIVKRVAMSARVSRELRANVLCHDLSVWDLSGSVHVNKHLIAMKFIRHVAGNTFTNNLWFDTPYLPFPVTDGEWVKILYIKFSSRCIPADNVSSLLI